MNQAADILTRNEKKQTSIGIEFSTIPKRIGRRQNLMFNAIMIRSNSSVTNHNP